MQASEFVVRNLRKSSRRVKLTCDGSTVSAVTSYGLPRIEALTPMISPGSAIFVMRRFPSDDDIVSFARPLQSTNTPRGCSPSTNRSDPFGYTLVYLM